MDLQSWILVIAIGVIIIGSGILFFKVQKFLFKILLALVMLVLLVVGGWWVWG